MFMCKSINKIKTNYPHELKRLTKIFTIMDIEGRGEAQKTSIYA